MLIGFDGSEAVDSLGIKIMSALPLLNDSMDCVITSTIDFFNQTQDWKLAL